MTLQLFLALMVADLLPLFFAGLCSAFCAANPDRKSAPPDSLTRYVYKRDIILCYLVWVSCLFLALCVTQPLFLVFLPCYLMIVLLLAFPFITGFIALSSFPSACLTGMKECRPLVVTLMLLPVPIICFLIPLFIVLLSLARQSPWGWNEGESDLLTSVIPALLFWCGAVWWNAHCDRRRSQRGRQGGASL